MDTSTAKFSRRGRTLVALTLLVWGSAATSAEAASYAVNFDPPGHAAGAVVTTGPGGITFPGSPVVFSVPGGATQTPPNALRQAGNCPNSGSVCTTTANLLQMDFAHPARRVSFRVGTVVPNPCFELDCPDVKAVAFDEPGHTVVAETEPTPLTSSTITVELKVPPTGASPPYNIDRVIYGVGEDPITGAALGGYQYTAQIDNLGYDVLEPADPPPPPPDPLPAPPEITIDSPTDGARLRGLAVSVSGRATSPAGLGAFCVSVDSATLPIPCDRTDLVRADGTFEIPRLAGTHPGTNSITAWARDTRGQLRSTSVSIEIAPIEPFEVMTYNVQARSGPIGTADEYDYGLDERRRATMIGSYVRGTGVDVVAMNEVFDEDFRTSLHRSLRGDYPFSVSKVGGAGLSEDSGLALYSKFRFIQFSLRDRPGLCAAGRAQRCTVAFKPYGNDCEGVTGGGSDCLADKGVAYVRLDNPSTGAPLNVFFTHMDSGGDRTDRIERRNQLNNHIAPMMAAYAPAGEDAILMGDLNVVDCSLRRCASSERGGDDAGEYRRFAAKIAELGLVDVLRAYGLPADSGDSHTPQSNSRGQGGGYRLDYFLVRSPSPGSLCAHRVLTENDEVTGRFTRSQTSISDHEPVRVVLGSADPGCSAASAEPLLNVPSTFLAAGATHWYRYEAPGTYLVDVSLPAGGQVDVAAFEASGRQARTVSGPVSWTDASTGPQVIVARGPLFLAVRNPGVGLTFAMTVRPALGGFATAADLTTAPALDPLSPHSFELGAGASRAFRLSLQHPHSGRPVTLSAESDSAAGTRLRLLDAAGTELARGSGSLSASIDGGPYEREDYFLVVDSTSASAFTPTVSWSTDVAILDLYKLWCNEQEDNTGDDSIYMQVSVDGGPGENVDLGSFDGGQSKFMPAESRGFRFHELAFQDSVRIVLRERDVDPDDTLGEVRFTRAADGTLAFSRRPLVLAAPLRVPRQSSVRFSRDEADYKLHFWASAFR